MFTVGWVLKPFGDHHHPKPGKLRNHLGQIGSVDFFTVPTIRLQVLFVLLVIEHRRREVLHFNVTDHPTSAWVAQQIVEAFTNREAPNPRWGWTGRCERGDGVFTALELSRWSRSS